MRTGSRHIGAGLTLLSFAIAFLQRPGETTADTKIDLHVEPARFLGEVASVWSSSGGLGQVQAGQYSGYLWPMGPFYSLGDLAGLPDWVVHRLWLALLLTAAAWGVVKLLERLLEQRPAGRTRGRRRRVRRQPVRHDVHAGDVGDAARVRGTAVAHARRPQRRCGGPRGWWWPALFALVFTSTGGGVNAAVTGWLLLGPAPLPRSTSGSRARYRGGPRGRSPGEPRSLSVAASLWWVVPVGVHAAFGINFLPFTESAGAIWATTSIPESLRLMGYWLSYLGGGFGGAAAAVLRRQLRAPLLASRRRRVAARAGAHARRARVVAAVALRAVLPAAPARRAARHDRGLPGGHADAARRHGGVQPRRAGPVPAHHLQGRAARRARARVPGRASPPPSCGGGCRHAHRGSPPASPPPRCWPSRRGRSPPGRAIDPKFSFDEVPDAWEQAADRVDSRLGPNARALILPGQLYAFYDWGATVDPILPALAERPVTSKTAVPYSDLRAVDALWTLDAGIQQERLVPAQLEGLLDWLGVGMVVTGTDDDLERSGAPAADGGRTRAVAGGARPAGRGVRAGARVRPALRVAHRAGAAAAGARLRHRGRGPRPGGAAAAGAWSWTDRPRAWPRSPPSARSTAGEPLDYAADLDQDELATAVGEASELVITDSNRRRIVSPSRPRQTWGRTLEADEDIPVDAPQLEPFGDQDADEQTVAVLSGAESLRSPFASGFPQFPEHRPYAAFDGDTDTWWEADRELRGPNRWVEVRFGAPRDVPSIEVLPRRQDATVVTEVEVAGRRFALEPGWNSLELGLPDVDRLRVRITGRDLPEGRRGGPGALAEIRVPGLHVQEQLRPPRTLERAMAGPDLKKVRVTYLFARATGDRPFLRQPVTDPDAAAVPDEHSVEPALIREAGDAERDIEREIEPAQAREYDVDAWVSAAADSSDPALDRLAGFRGPQVFTSSSRYEGRPGVRASSAFDGDSGHRVGRPRRRRDRCVARVAYTGERDRRVAAAARASAARAAPEPGSRAGRRRGKPGARGRCRRRRSAAAAARGTRLPARGRRRPERGRRCRRDRRPWGPARRDPARRASARTLRRPGRACGRERDGAARHRPDRGP